MIDSNANNRLMETNSHLCDANASALLVVDIQPNLTATMSEEESEQMLNNSRVLLEAAGALNIPVFVTEQYPQGLGKTDQSIIEKLPQSAQEFEKTGFSSCAAEGFKEGLKASGRKQAIIVGQEAHVCVMQTAFDLLTNDHRVYVVEDAICSRKQTHKFFALQRMMRSGITITNYESVLFEWLRDAAHPEFKKLSKLIR